MEAAGLAVGVVGFGLQLATTLQTYVEGVAGAEDRLRELSFDVASTASTLKQLQDMLDADKAVVENTSSDQDSTGTTIFTDQGRRDIYSLSRRCEKVYQGILRVIVGASAPPSDKGRAIARNIGLSDLTATRLAHFGRNLKWPWVEPRVKACQGELRWLKMDLLLHLQVATVARIHLQPSKRAANSEDESTLEAIAERLIAQRAVYRKAALDGRRQRKAPANTAKAEATSGPLLAAIHKSSSLELKEKSLDNNQRGVQETQVSVLATNLVQIPSGSGPRGLYRLAGDSTKGYSRSAVSGDTRKETTRGNANVRSTKSLNPLDKEDGSRSLGSALLHGNSRPPSSHASFASMLLKRHPEAIQDEKSTNDPFDIEAWTLPRPGVEPRRLPFKREAIVQRMQLTTKNGDASSWDQFLALTPKQRDQVQNLIAQLGRDDGPPRKYLALETREDEIVVFVAVSELDVVYLTDPIGRTWQFPYDNFTDWWAAKDEICLLEGKDASLQQKIRNGQYDIRAESGALIPPGRWHHFVKPGVTLEMVVWREDPPSITHPSTSLGKWVRQKLFTLKQWTTKRALARRVLADGLADGLTDELPVEFPVELASTYYCLDESKSKMSEATTPTPVLSGVRSNIDAKDRQSTHSSCRSSKIREMESHEMEFDDEDLFGFDDDEEDDLDAAVTSSELLARWTHADKR